jgi:hypothetical protein
MSLKDVTIRDFRAEDIGAMGSSESIAGRECVLLPSNYAITYEWQGKPVASAGLIRLWPGVAEAWTILGAIAKSHPLWIVRVFREQIRSQAIVMKLHRVQMHVRDDAFLLKWGDVLGFTREGTLRRYTKDQQTMHILSWIPNAHT